MPPPVHRFSATQRELRDRFFEMVETRDEWTEKEKIGEGESDSWRVENNHDGMRGVAKPGPTKAAEDQHFRAAHEKIAFDLSCLVHLPVAPVVLWAKDVGTIYKVGRSISCWGFPQGQKWAATDQVITNAQRQSVGPIAAAMHVFTLGLEITTVRQITSSSISTVRPMIFKSPSLIMGTPCKAVGVPPIRITSPAFRKIVKA